MTQQKIGSMLRREGAIELGHGGMRGLVRVPSTKAHAGYNSNGLNDITLYINRNEWDVLQVCCAQCTSCFSGPRQVRVRKR